MKTFAFLKITILCIYSMIFGGHNLQIKEAEAILGEPCIQNEQTSTAENGGHQFKTNFVAKSDEKVKLYYLFDSFETETSANNKFDEFYAGNASLTGFQKLENLGSEAFYHTDSENFSLIIARKGNEMIRIKVNKINPKFSKKQMIEVTQIVLERI
jgi:hypothetical protein